MSELGVQAKEHRRRKMKLRRTQDLISQEILSEDKLASAKKPIKKVKKTKNHTFLPQIDDLFDSGIKTNYSKEINLSSSTSETDFKKPVVDKKAKTLKTSNKINCNGQSWLVESFTDVSSCAESTKENFETVNCKKSFTKKKKNSGSVQKNKPKITVLDNTQLKPCFVLLDKLKYNDKINDESLKFFPSNSSSPILRRTGSDFKVSQRQSSLTKEMFEELPNCSQSDYWDVEDLNKPKAEDGSKSVSNIRNTTYELNLPSLNSTVDLSTSKKSLKNNSTYDIENPLDISQRKKSIQSQSLTAMIKPTVSEEQTNINVVDKSKLENGSKSVSNINNLTHELNGSVMNGTINLSTSRKSFKNNSTFEIDKPLDISRKQPQQRNSIHSQSSEKQKILEVEDVVNKTNIESGSKSISSEDNSKTKLTSEKRRRTRNSKNVKGNNHLKTIDKSASAISDAGTEELLSSDKSNHAETPSSFLAGNLLTDSEKCKKVKLRSKFTANDNVTNNEVFQSPKPQRKKWVISDENQRSSSRQSLSKSWTNIFNSPVPIKRRTIGESSTKLSIFNKEIKQSPVKLPALFLNQESGFISQTLDETSRTPDGDSNVFIFDRKSPEAQKTPDKFSNATYSTSTEKESSVLSEHGQPEVITRRRSTLTLDDTVTDVEILKSACDLYGSPKELEQYKEPRRSRGATKKLRRVTFKDQSVIVIDDSESSFEQGTPIIAKMIISDSENDSFTVTSTTTSPCEPRRRISSDSSLYKKSIGLNHKIRLASDDLANKNKNLASSSRSKLKKMPNFAKIHQKMYDKMPDLREYSEKKKERARLLLSGKKLPTQPEKIVPVTKKQLFPSTSASTKSNLVTSTPNVNKKMIGYTRFGFKVAPRNMAARQEQVKAVATKMRPAALLPRQRFKEELKGVRSNKRFELLMKMREK